MLQNMKVGMRLGLSFCLLLVFMIGIIVVCLNEMENSRENIERIVTVNNVRDEKANIMVDCAREVSIALRNVFLQKDSEKAREIKAQIAEYRKTYDEALAKLEELTPQDATELVEKISHVNTSQETSRALNSEVLDLTIAGKADEAIDLLLKKASPAVGEWITQINKMIKLNQERSTLRYSQIQKDQDEARSFIFILGTVVIALAIVISIVLTLGITRPLNLCVHAANRIAAKDLTVDLSAYKDRGDELGSMTQSFSKMAEALSEQIHAITDGVNILASSSNEILVSTTQVATGSVESATAISETMTTVEEVRQAARLSSEKAKNVADCAQRVVQVSQAGKSSVDQTVGTMLHIRDQMGAIAQTIVRLSEQGQAIGGIIASVTDLADQSNLLAVNAGIEAARAGEHGKGFAVVAQEIKTLAEQSKQATTQIRGILTDVQKATSAAVMATEQGTKAVETGVKQSAQTGEAITILADASMDASQVATQIAASSHQQVVGMDQIGVAMANINQAGTQNASAMKQAEIAAKNLNELGQKLQKIVDQFKIKEA